MSPAHNPRRACPACPGACAHAHGLTSGSEIASGIRNISFTNVRIGAGSPVKLKSQCGRGAYVQDVLYENITGYNIDGSAVWMDMQYGGDPFLSPSYTGDNHDWWSTNPNPDLLVDHEAQPDSLLGGSSKPCPENETSIFSNITVRNLWADVIVDILIHCLS